MQRPIPTGLLTLAQMSAAVEEHGLDPFADFERVTVPLDRCPTEERLRVAKWAAMRGGPVPTTTTAFRVRSQRLQQSLPFRS